MENKNDKSYYSLCINTKEIKDFNILKPEERAQVIYNNFLIPFIDEVDDYLNKKDAFFSDVKVVLDKKFKKVYKSINDNISIASNMTNYSDDNLRTFIKGHFKKNKNLPKKFENFSDDTLGIGQASFNKRFTECRGFTRDELISMAIYLELDQSSTNKLIELCNLAFSKDIASLQKNNKRDLFLLSIIAEQSHKKHNTISDILINNGFSSLEFMNRG